MSLREIAGPPNSDCVHHAGGAASSHAEETTATNVAVTKESGLRLRRAKKYRAIGFKLNRKGFPVPDHPSAKAGKILLLKSLGIDDLKLYNIVLEQLIDTACRKQFDVQAVNAMLGFAQSIRPKDQLEAMLALQMAAIHCKSMRYISKVERAVTLEEHATYERTATRLLRTFGCQVEALRKHRHGGSQNVYVRHVHVQDGGQAVVGNVSKHADYWIRDDN